MLNKGLRTILPLCLVLFVAVAFAGAEENPAEKSAEHPAQGTPSMAKPGVSKAELAVAITEHVAKESAKSDGVFQVKDEVSGKTLKLKLTKVHEERLSQVGADLYFVCADFDTIDGKKTYDLDFFMKGKDAMSLKVTEVLVHKEDGKERYTWAEKDGLWHKMPLGGDKGSEHPGGEHDSEKSSEHPK